MTQQNGFIQERVGAAVLSHHVVQGQVDVKLSKPGSAVQCKDEKSTGFQSTGRISVHSDTTLIIENHQSS